MIILPQYLLTLLKLFKLEHVLQKTPPASMTNGTG